MRIPFTALVLAVTTLFVACQPAIAEVDFGDQKSETLTGKAWKALDEQKLDEALAYTGKCIELYEKEAKKMQEALKELPAEEPKEETQKRWALNDVGTCLFIKGEVLLKKDDKKGAKETFDKLVKEFKFSRCWDPQGWFWKPADAAKERLEKLEEKK